MPALVLLLEGPRLSIHAAWTIYQNRVGYAPLTPVGVWVCRLSMSLACVPCRFGVAG